MSTIPEIAEDLVSDFSMFDDWMDKYQLIIDMGNSLDPIGEADKTDENIVRGCQSRVWLVADLEGDKVQYRADSDAIITKGLVSLLTGVLSDHTPDEILGADLSFIDKIGIRDHLSPTRSNGLNAMMKQMMNYALAYKAKLAMNN
ncbi:MAG: SufE family protein [Bacteroidia bacterium]